jgi:hypothetical protein
MGAVVTAGRSLIPTNVALEAPHAVIDVPRGHEAAAWPLDHVDTSSPRVVDSPRPDATLVVMAVADRGRVHPRRGSATA